ncbi:MAG: molybdenum cofactor guanylyltransferase [Acidimicrobiia bacterium]
MRPVGRGAGAPAPGPFSAVVLTGGRSRRMGRDKALLPIDGLAMAARVAAAMAAAGADEVFCVGGDVDGLRALGLEAVPDRHPGQGPLGGLVTAFARARRPVLLAAPCDLLHPSAVAMAAVVSRLAAAPAAVLGVVPLAGGVRQPLDGAYRSAVGPVLAAAFAAGERSVKGAVAAVAVIELDTPVPDAHADADVPADLR